jgi:hypothetical protein
MQIISRRKEGENGAAIISTFQAAIIQNRSDATHRQKNKLTGIKNLKIEKIQKFNFNAHAYIN